MPLRIRSAAGAELRFFSTIATFGTAVDITVAELSIESFFPADAATAAAMRAAYARRPRALARRRATLRSGAPGKGFWTPKNAPGSVCSRDLASLVLAGAHARAVPFGFLGSRPTGR